MSNCVREETVYGTRKVVFTLALVLALAGCGSEQAQGGNSGATEGSDGGSTTVAAVEGKQELTPVVGEVMYAPIPFSGSDGKTHLVYELETTNFSSGDTTMEGVEVLDAGSGDAVATLDAEEVAGRFQPGGSREAGEGSLAPSETGLLFLHLTFDGAGEVPDRLVHRLSVRAEAAPPDQQQITEEMGEVDVDFLKVVVAGPPLKGSNYLAADSCCDATRHTRAVLPINGQLWVAQRYAVDYEQLDDENRIYSGEKEDPESYEIYGKEAIAVADGTVVKVLDGLPEQTPGKFPEGISLDEADGNFVILDIGGGNYANYAHFQPGSIRVKEGDRVKRGDVLALVGNSGNSLAPHLHFHVVDAPLSLVANGLPYAVDSFEVTGQTAGGTKAFDKAEADSTPLEIMPDDPSERISDAMPLDQSLVNFE